MDNQASNGPAWDNSVPFSAVDTAVRQTPAQAQSPRKPCPFCREQIQPDARKCPYCEEYLDSALAEERAPLKPLSGTAKASFWLGLLSPLFLCLPAPLAVLLGFGALVSPNRRKTRGTGMALIGLVLGLVWTAVLVLVIVKGQSLVPSQNRLPLF